MFSFSAISEKIRGYDWVLFTAALLLSLIGLTAVYSIDRSRGADLIFFPTQALALILGLAVAAAISRFHNPFFESGTRPAYILSILLLTLVLILGVSVRGTTGWFRLGSLSFQPAEAGKVALILALALAAARQGRRFDTIGFAVRSGVMTLALAGLVLLQPDFGSALVFLALWFGMLIVAKTKWRYLLIIAGSGIAALVLGWFFIFAPYQKDRLVTFLHPSASPLSAGYNVNQSIIAVGAGQVFGRGLGFGSQSQLHFLPEAQTDFIFAVIAEELGFVGAIFVLALFAAILWRITRIALHSENDFSAYAAVGFALVVFIHVCLNLGAALGLLPVTGLTLPFVSYGGTSLLVMWTLVGIAESIAKSSR